MLSFKDLQETDKRALFEQHDYFFFDIDGVVYRGGALIAGAAEVLNRLNSWGKVVKLCTNNCAVPRQYVHKVLSAAMPFLQMDDIISSGVLAAKYLRNWKDKNETKTIYVSGMPGLLKELDDLHLDYITSKNEEISSVFDVINIKLNKDVGAVLLGADVGFSYFKLVELVNYVRDPQVGYVLTHIDKVMAGSGDIALIPGAGSMAAAVEAASGRRPINVGKPSDFAEAFLRSQIPRGKKGIFIGDMLSSDIVMGNKCEMTTIFVLSGVSTLADAQKALKDNITLQIPNYYTDSIADLLDSIKK